MTAEKIKIENGKLIVPNNPIRPFIEGDGIGPDIWRAAVRVFDAAVEKFYAGERGSKTINLFCNPSAPICRKETIKRIFP